MAQACSFTDPPGVGLEDENAPRHLMDTANLEKGMVVQPKSGGPTMTVRPLVGSQAYCEWFKDCTDGLERSSHDP